MEKIFSSKDIKTFLNNTRFIEGYYRIEKEDLSAFDNDNLDTIFLPYGESAKKFPYIPVKLLKNNKIRTDLILVLEGFTFRVYQDNMEEIENAYHSNYAYTKPHCVKPYKDHKKEWSKFLLNNYPQLQDKYEQEKYTKHDFPFKKAIQSYLQSLAWDDEIEENNNELEL